MRHFGVVFLWLLAGLLACSDIDEVETGRLLIEPEEVVFSVPERGSRVSRARVELYNVGQGPLPLVGVRIEEQDELAEIAIVDEADHQGERYLAPNDVEYVTLEWTALDAVADTGALPSYLTTAHPLRFPYEHQTLIQV